MGIGRALCVAGLSCIISGCGNLGIKNLDSGILILSREECNKSGGVWDYWTRLDSASREKSCNILSGDFGEECYNSDDCEGFCLSAGGRGECSEYLRPYGCMNFYEDGKIDKVCFD